MNDHESYGDAKGWRYHLVMTATHSNGVSDSCEIRLTIIADCSAETVAKPSDTFADQAYTVNDAAVVISYTDWNAWTSTRDSCQISYALRVDGVLEASLPYDLISTTASGLRIYSTYNYWGGQALTVTYTGCNNSTVCLSETFTLTVSYDCLTNTVLDYSGTTFTT